jgi:hypothetical protein
MGLSFLVIVASSLVVVHDLDFRWAFRRPNKAHPELVVNTALARACGLPRTRIERVASEQTGITADTALRLAKAYASGEGRGDDC